MASGNDTDLAFKITSTGHEISGGYSRTCAHAIDGGFCNEVAREGSDFCDEHLLQMLQMKLDREGYVRSCMKVEGPGRMCGRNAAVGSHYCVEHKDQMKELDDEMKEQKQKEAKHLDIEGDKYIFGVPNPVTNTLKFMQRFTSVEESLNAYKADAKVPPHMASKVGDVVHKDKERRDKLRMRYMEAAEEERDDGNRPYRVVFLALADWVKQGVGSVRQHRQLMDDFDAELERYHDDSDYDSDLDD